MQMQTIVATYTEQLVAPLTGLALSSSYICSKHTHTHKIGKPSTICNKQV